MGNYMKAIGYVAAAGAAISMMAGCTNIADPLNSAMGNISEGTISLKDDIQNGSHTTKYDDKDVAVEVTMQDENGETHTIMSAIMVQPIEGVKISLNDLRDFLGRNEIPWKQLNLGADTTQMSKSTAYVYMPDDISYEEMVNLPALFETAGYDAKTVTPDEYQAYKDKGEDFYFVENTYYPMQ